MTNVWKENYEAIWFLGINLETEWKIHDCINAIISVMLILSLI